MAIRWGGRRVRGLLGLVAVAALAMGAEGFRRRRAYCLERSTYHRALMVSNHGMRSFMVRGPEEEDRIARDDAHAAWHLGVARGFARSADRPWEPIPPEPSEPEDYFLHHALGGFDVR